MHESTSGAGTLYVAIVDEYPAHSQGVALGLRDTLGMSVAFVAMSGSEARLRIEASAPDVLLVEPWMRTGDGLGLMHWVAAQHPGITVIALSRMWDTSHVDEAMAAGARAHLPKSTPTEDLSTIIRHVRAGAVMRPAVAPHDTPRMPLTTREREVVRLVANGMKNSQIAKELFVTEQTVKFHVRNIFRKLSVTTRTEAAFKAARLGIVS